MLVRHARTAGPDVTPNNRKVMMVRASMGAAAVMVMLAEFATPLHGQVAPRLHVDHTTAAILAVETARPNDNRRAAGVMHGDTLVLHLDVRMARWYPESDTGAFITAAIVGEVGQAPQVPGPLVRVREGTPIVATLTNNLTDSTVSWIGIALRPGSDSTVLAPGASITRRFVAGAPGTYLYSVRIGNVDRVNREREQAAGAFVIDAKGARTDDRIFVMNIWGDLQKDTVTYRNALTINGRGWPFTERITATVGDTLRWRIVNASSRVHPMHLHGFYFKIRSRGDGRTDSTFTARNAEDVVTELMNPYSTMGIEWIAARDGRWLFHCHLSFHVSADARYEAGVAHADHVSGDMMRHMAGLVLGIDVARRPGRGAEARANARALRLLVQEAPRRTRAKRALAFVVQHGAEPARDSVVLPGTTLVLTRGHPTDITVVNHLAEPTAVHWHGIELESFSDGVAGWSGDKDRMARFIAPNDSFVAHLTLRRAGTFIYHTHLNDVEQLTSGLYGGIVVLEPGQLFNPERDHLFVVGWDGEKDPPHLLVNGDSAPPPLTLRAGVHHRLRFAFIGAVDGETFTLRRDTNIVTWRQVARDGFTIPAARRHSNSASIQGWAGQTFDFDIAPTAGAYTLTVGDPKKPDWQQTITVR